VVREAIAFSKERDLFPPQRPNGNELTDTRYLYILAGESLEPAVFAVSSTKLKTYKNLMARYHNWRVVNSKGDKVQPPLAALRIKLTSYDDVAGGHDFMNLTMEPAVGNDLNSSMLAPNDERLQIALKVVDDFDASRIKVDYAAERVAKEPTRDAEVFDNAF
jgi:hypothetical protein